MVLLVVKGKAGKSKVLVENFVSDNILIVETAELSLSKMIGDKFENMGAIILPSNDLEHQIAVLKMLSDMYENATKEEIEGSKVDIIFYLNVKGIDAVRFFDFEESLKGFDYKRIIVTVQSENEEIQYIEYK